LISRINFLHEWVVVPGHPRRGAVWLEPGDLFERRLANGRGVYRFRPALQPRPRMLSQTIVLQLIAV
jgi:hypothetical protein